MSNRSSMRRDVLSAYAASLSKLGSWAIVSAVVFRQSVDAFAVLALVRGTIGIVNYAALGLQPAMISAFAALKSQAATPLAALPVAPGPADGVLAYATPETSKEDRARNAIATPVQRIYGTGMSIVFFAVFVAVVVGVLGRFFAEGIFTLSNVMYTSDSVGPLTALMILGIAIRWLGDPASAYLQTHERLAIDNVIGAIADGLWAIAVVFFAPRATLTELLPTVGFLFLASGVFLAGARGLAAHRYGTVKAGGKPDSALARHLLLTGGLITLAQLADFLYAPTDYILINRLLAPQDLADYAPAIQIDAGLMILVTGLASVLLPKAALAHAAGDRQLVRRYYVVGTLATAGMLAVAGLVAWSASPWIFRVWLGKPLPGAVAILPLMLIHLVIGGSSAVGRSILLGIGKAKPLTIAVLISGLTNVACSYAFVKYAGLGLRGVVLGTIVAVVARCAVWMPCYVMRELKRENVKP